MPPADGTVPAEPEAAAAATTDPTLTATSAPEPVPGPAEPEVEAEPAKAEKKKHQAKFRFGLSERPFAPLNDKPKVELLNKWSMYDSMRVTRFRFDQPFQRYELDQFVQDFFNNEEVVAALQVLATVRGSWCNVGQADSVTAIKTEPVSCMATSMGFFDRFYDCGVVRPNGSICGCIPEYTEDDFCINQELGKIMLLEDSEHYATFSEDERRELLFRLFQHFSLGGPLNQYEDEIGPYFDIVKHFYKGLVSVGKDAKTGAVHSTSVAIQIQSVDGLNSLFPQDPDHPQNFMYLIVNPARREATVLYHAWCG